MLSKITADEIQVFIDLGTIYGARYPLAALGICYKMIKTLEENSLLSDKEFLVCIKAVNTLNQIVTISNQ